ncbi:MAG: hypothetical protein HFE85_02055 [Clostridiales bacterium]|nr:hypothetical protein [Clostridiales bacterium]
MKRRYYHILAAVTGLLFLLTFTASAVDFPAVSIQQQANACTIAGQTGETLEFSAQDLACRLGIPEHSIQSAVLTSVPDPQDGRLLIDGIEVNAYTRLKADELDRMVFVPTPEADKASLTLLPNGQSKTEVSITLHDNELPLLNAESGAVQTVMNIPVKGVLSVSGTDNLRCQILTQPEKGSVTLSGSTFTYEPYRDMTGSDRFTYCVMDESGNCSAPAEVTLEVSASVMSVTFADMKNNPNHYAAVKLCEKGILGGEKVGQLNLFYPEHSVTRGEFAVMLINAAKLSGSVVPCVNTGLLDDGDIPLWQKPYIKLALDAGIVTCNRLSGSETITRAEAAVMTARAASLPDVPEIELTVQDAGDIPDWAAQSYRNLIAYKMIDFYDGSAHPSMELGRDHAADLLWQLWKYKDSH